MLQRVTHRGTFLRQMRIFAKWSIRHWPMRWLIFCAVFTGLLVVNHTVLDRLNHARPDNRGRTLVTTAGGDYDYVVLGSSAAANAIDFDALEQQLDASVFPLALAGTAYPEQHLALDLFLSRNQVTTLIFQVDNWGLADGTYSYPFHEYFYLPYLDDPVVERNLREYYGRQRMWCWKWIPMYMYSDFNLHIGLQGAAKLLRKSRPVEFVDGVDGDQMDAQTLARIRQAEDAHRLDWNETRKAYFERILQLARQCDLRVIMILAPTFTGFDAAESNADEFVTYYTTVARESDVPFFVCRDQTLRNDPGNYIDGAHLNRRGAKRYTRLLADFVDSQTGNAL